MSVLLYGAKTWTLLAADVQTLQAFHVRCQRQILNIRWWAHVSNAEMLQRSGLLTISDIIRHRRLSLFGHAARLDPGVVVVVVVVVHLYSASRSASNALIV